MGIGAGIDVGVAADRTTMILPQHSDANVQTIPSAAVFPDQAMGDAASDGWHAYMRLWKAHHQDPSSGPIRKFLGLPLRGSVSATVKRGRSAPRWLSWKPGSYQQIDTPHFMVFSRAPDSNSVAVAEDLERCYWVWTQMFFPMWEASAQVSTTLANLGQHDVTDFLKDHPARIKVKRKMRVILFRDAAEYQRTLAADVPGIQRSTGFYHDQNETIFLYAAAQDAAQDAAATRRHELVHQLFREASRSTLGRKRPGEEKGFWIVEGIAGYFESLRLGKSLATVGGWDSPRLQFARYRVLVNDDVMSFAELRADGRLPAQQRSDIARWYAHSIAQTHHLIDGGDFRQRVAVYQLLDQRYACRSGISGGSIQDGIENRLRRFLAVDDQVIRANPISYPLNELCLAKCQVTANGLQQLPPSPSLRWLDLTRLPVANDDVVRLAPNPSSIKQLSLEMTQVDASLRNWLKKATQLRELDLSHTPMDDAVMKAISTAKHLEVLWITGTQISDHSIDAIKLLPKLQMINVQQSKFTQQGISRLRNDRPKLDINP